MGIDRKTKEKILVLLAFFTPTRLTVLQKVKAHLWHFIPLPRSKSEFNRRNYVRFPVDRTENSQALDLGAQFLKIYFASKISLDFFFHRKYNRNSTLLHAENCFNKTNTYKYFV